MSNLKTHLFRRNSRYYFRCRIPYPLVLYYQKKDIKFSLRTSCPKAAKRRCAVVDMHLGKMFEEHKIRVDMSDDEINLLRAENAIFKDQLSGLVEQLSIIIEEKEESEALADMIADFAVLYQEEASRLRETSDLKSQMLDNLSKQKILETAFAQQKLDKAESRIDKLIENVGSVQSDKPKSAVKAELFRFYCEEAIREAVESRGISKHSADKNWTQYNLFMQIVGEKQITEYTRDDIRIYAQTLSLLPTNVNRPNRHKGKSIIEIIDIEDIRRIEAKKKQARGEEISVIGTYTEANVEKHFNSVKAVFEQAAEFHKDLNINLSLWKGIKLSGAEGTSREVWTVDELNQLLKGPVWTGRNKRFVVPIRVGKAIVRDSWYWLPLIALYSGMRMGEITKLRACDIQSKNGIDFIDINKDIGSVKTDNSVRQIPIHSKLLELGFFDQLVKDSGGKRLFPDIETPSESDGWSKEFSRSFSKYKLSFGFAKDFHSFRHTFASACYDATKDILAVAKICGHSPAESSTLAHQKAVDVETLRYIHLTLQQQNEAVQAVEYKGLDLSHLIK